MTEIIGYACGIDMTPALDYDRKEALFTYALSNANWANRRQGALELALLAPPLKVAPILFKLLRDPNRNVGFAAAIALANVADRSNGV